MERIRAVFSLNDPTNPEKAATDGTETRAAHLVGSDAPRHPISFRPSGFADINTGPLGSISVLAS